MFNVGDEVEYKTEGVHLKATITSIETRFSGRVELWGIWKNVDHPEYDTARPGYCWADDNITLVQPAMMQYDPNQQGDKEDDI